MTIFSQTVRVRAANRILSRLFGAAGSGAILCAIFFFLRSLMAGAGIIVEEPNCVLNDLILERDYDIDFRVHNRTGHSVRIVGMGIT